MENTRRYAPYQAPLMAFFKPDLYADAVQNWKGIAGWYMFLLTTVAVLVSVSGLMVQMSKMSADPQIAAFFEQIPKMKLTAGKLTSSTSGPVQIKDKEGAVLVLIDTSRSGQERNDSDPPIVVTSDYMLVPPSDTALASTSNNAAQDMALSALPDMELSGQDLLSMLKLAAVWIPVGLFAIGTPLVFIGYLIQMLIYGGIAMLIANNMEAKITYGGGMRLAAIAMTPAIVLSAIIAAMVPFVPSLNTISGIFSFASIGIVIGFIVLGCTSLKGYEAPAPAGAR